MSFGYSIGDGIVLVQLAYKVLEGARKACGEHDDLTREVASLHKVLQRLRKELVSPDSLLHRADDRRQELDEHCKAVEALLKVIDDVITKYSLLSSKDRKKAAQRLWQKVRFGNGELKDMADIRLKLATYTSAISMSLNICSLGSQGRVEKELRNVSVKLGEGLEGITAKLDWSAANITAQNRDGTIWTNYDNDDKSFWRQLRRDLINEGYHSKALVKHKELLKNYVAELGQRGAFDEVSSDEDTEIDQDDEEHGSREATEIDEDGRSEPYNSASEGDGICSEDEGPDKSREPAKFKTGQQQGASEEIQDSYQQATSDDREVSADSGGLDDFQRSGTLYHVDAPHEKELHMTDQASSPTKKPSSGNIKKPYPAETELELRELCGVPFYSDWQTGCKRPGVISDENIQKISACIKDVEGLETSERPRIYAVLHMMSRQDLLPAFVAAGFHDSSLPYSDRQSFPPLMREDEPDACSRFLELQAHVMSPGPGPQKDESPHVMAESGDVFFQHLQAPAAETG
jgi:hypothetical protein